MEASQIITSLNLLSDDVFGMGKVSFASEWKEEKQRREIQCKSIVFKPKRKHELKAVARTGLSNTVRRRWWFVLSGGFELYSRTGDIYESSVQVAQQMEKTENSFFGLSYPLLNFLPKNIADFLPEFLHTIYYFNRNIDFCPLIPVVSSMLLMYMEPELAYISMQSIINRSLESNFYFLTNKKQLFAQIKALEQLIKSRMPRVVARAQKLKISIGEVLMVLVPSFFIPFNSIPSSLTFFDSFLSEGRKVLFRFTLQLLIDVEINLLMASTSSTFISVLINGVEALSNPEQMGRFIQSAFKLKMKRKNHIEKIEKRFTSSSISFSLPKNLEIENLLLSSNVGKNEIIYNDYLDQANESSNDSLESKKTSEIVVDENHMRTLHAKIVQESLPHVNGEGRLLNEAMILLMKNEMSSIFSHYSADLAYKLSRDGALFLTLFQKCSLRCQYILMIETRNKVIGAFLSDPIHPSISRYYYGTGMTFVFDATNSNFYRLKYSNSQFIHVCHEAISIGGPSPAIYLDSDLKRVFSSECETFGSPSLTANENGDMILDIEIYRFTSPYHFTKRKPQTASSRMSLY